MLESISRHILTIWTAQSINKNNESVNDAVGSRNDKNSMARKRTYAETVANYVTPRVAPQIAIATHV